MTALIGLAVAASAWANPTIVTIVVAIAASASSLILFKSPGGAIAAAFFPLAALWEGERGLMFAWTATMLLSFIWGVLRASISGTIERMGRLALSVTLSGFFLSYVVLLRQAPEGNRLVIAFVMIAVVFDVVAFAFGRFGSMFGVIAGLVAATVVGLLSTFLLPEFFDIDSMLVLATATALAAWLGTVIDKQMWSQRIVSLTFAAPVFFYGFRLLLT